MLIYTKKGDRGETGLFSGNRIGKDSLVIEAIGSVDELNSALGVAAEKIKNQKSKIKNSIQKIQIDLMGVGAVLGGYETSLNLEGRVEKMEKEIDQMWKEMPELKNFILPRGQLHLARAVCRRAERAVVRIKDDRAVNSQIIKYLNRLSDYLFCLARWENFKKGIEERVWRS